LVGGNRIARRRAGSGRTRIAKWTERTFNQERMIEGCGDRTRGHFRVILMNKISKMKKKKKKRTLDIIK
jgi:hypothetical protein